MPTHNTSDLAEPHAAADADRLSVERLQAGDDTAFDGIMARHKQPLLNFAYRMLGTEDGADDIAQEVFVRAYFAIKQHKFKLENTKFSTWLFTLARNACMDSHRRRKRRPTEPLLNEHESRSGLSSPVTTSDNQAQAHEIGDLIAKAVSELPEDQRTAVVLSEYEDMSYAEIAKVLKTSPKSVECRLYRAKKYLRSQLAHLLT